MSRFPLQLALALALFAFARPAAATVGATQSASPVDTWLAKVRADPAAAVAARGELQAEIDRWIAAGVLAQPSERAAFARAATLHEWLAMAESAQGALATPEALAAYAALADGPIPRELFVVLDGRDDAASALRILLDLQRADPAGVAEFPSLAVALAVVFDQPFPAWWPHPQVARAKIPLADLSPTERFALFRAAERRKLLAYRLRDLTAQHLKFVVDTLLSPEELTWAQKQIRPRLGSFDRLFSSIDFDTTRVLTGSFVWPHEQYRLEDIRKEGGICVDQAYYAAQAGKAVGIPTLFFIGTGDYGHHAWVGYLETLNRWDFNVGRYDAHNYPVGHAYDPQTRRFLSDEELLHLTRTNRRDAALFEATMIWRWAMRSPEDARLGLLREARRSVPDFAPAWRAEAKILEGAPLAERERFWTTWVAAFDRQSDLKIEGVKALVALAEEKGDKAASDRLRNQALRESRQARADLGVDVGSDAVLTLVEQEDWERAGQAFRGVVMRMRGEGSGLLFYELVVPYVGACIKQGQVQAAEKAMRYVRTRLEIAEGSPLEQDYARLEMAVESAAKRK